MVTFFEDAPLDGGYWWRLRLGRPLDAGERGTLGILAQGVEYREGDDGDCFVGVKAGGDSAAGGKIGEGLDRARRLLRHWDFVERAAEVRTGALTVGQLVELLLTFDQSMHVLFEQCSDYSELTPDLLCVARAAVGRGDGYVGRERRDLPSRDVLLFPGN